jgi:hypothetical protein
MRRPKPDAIHQLRYEDDVLRHLLTAINDEHRDRLQHGRVVKVFVEPPGSEGGGPRDCRRGARTSGRPC